MGQTTLEIMDVLSQLRLPLVIICGIAALILIIAYILSKMEAKE